MADKRTVAIAGGGIAGFAAAAALARHGFDVRVYEQSEEPREFGAGIYLKENSLQVLDRLGISDQLAAKGQRLNAVRVVDEAGKMIINRTLEDERLIVTLRADLHTALRDAALDAGAELITRRRVAGASPEGVLHFEGGDEVKADLVIGADGLHSRVRDLLGLARINARLGDGATRVLIPREEEPYSTEYWSGQHRVGVAPCSPDWTYSFIIGPEREDRVRRLPLDRAYWTKQFPHLEHVFARVSDETGIHHAHAFVYCDTWVAGRVAIIGDAAHAQPPNFGQGAGLAITAAWTMAETLADARDIGRGLVRWERQEKPRVDMVQRLTTAYDVAGYKWPPAFAGLRSKVFETLATTPFTASRWTYYWRGGIDAPDGLDELEGTAR
ncbi:NAD(P)-binding protein [Planosporangium flavigriseum]|uniref:Monooxygenase n=1 Tax=Planosporangium flavigriseum TaxID=373681 RepID=A0A8J3LST9_9ACTN|nr:FAD-dependent monooxygenase [Planosporangium flavigriseum]NJC67726.1 NAD(P)-binding protein [Planosporangium flavigriseum]GIG76003.1 monooxygenase [Planosporangium flavigriseum]